MKNISIRSANSQNQWREKKNGKLLGLNWGQTWVVAQTHGCNHVTHNTKQTNDDPNHSDVQSCWMHVTKTNLRAPQPLKTFVTQLSSVRSSKPFFDTLKKSPSQTNHLHAPWIMSELNKLLTHCLICHRRWMLTWWGSRGLQLLSLVVSKTCTWDAITIAITTNFWVAINANTTNLRTTKNICDACGN